MELLGNIEPLEIILLTSVLLWELIWKGFALWKSAQRKEKIWFVLILVLNTLGILPIVYLIMKRK